ncbi:hypothetical protein DOM22_02760 [Bdellovibrio sp. ZAP7]|uniref:hypothetical protein n=1 Tax=Bdellovibrio sp. ZAP7 TaxID=2231053 RepID=UPI001159363E|nr:hypothetical protein [Bdellovibrio sp. ZAP7]QDK44148.1 hypothetical protein DOM22_02760 [Bdellovibrio sp. ZAP7]
MISAKLFLATMAALSGLIIGKNQLPYDVVTIEAAKYPVYQALVDASYKKIFSVPQANEICRQFNESHAESFQAALGASRATVDEIIKNCQRKNTTPKDQVISYANTQVIFVITDQVDDFESWTEPHGNTYLFFKKISEITEPAVVARLAHETAIKFDITSNLINEMLFDGRYTGSKLYSTDDGTSYQIKYQSTCRSWSLLANPLFYFNFAAERARFFEAEVMRYLYGMNIRANSQTTCTGRFLENLPTIYRMTDAMYRPKGKLSGGMDTSSVADGMLPASCPKISKETTGQMVYKNLQELRKSTLTVNNHKIGFCQFLSVPHWGLPRVLGNRGPSPRIGGGWSPETNEIREIILTNPKDPQTPAKIDELVNRIKEIQKETLRKESWTQQQ